MEIIVEDGHVKVRRIRDGKIICAAFDKGGKQLAGLELSAQQSDPASRHESSAKSGLPLKPI